MIEDDGEQSEMMLQIKNDIMHLIQYPSRTLTQHCNVTVVLYKPQYKTRSIFKFGAHFFNSFAICFAFLRLAFLRCLRLFADSTFHILYNLISSYILDISEKTFFPQSFTLLAIHSLFFFYHFFRLYFANQRV